MRFWFYWLLAIITGLWTDKGNSPLVVIFTAGMVAWFVDWAMDHPWTLNQKLQRRYRNRVTPLCLFFSGNEFGNWYHGGGSNTWFVRQDDNQSQRD